MEKQAHKNAPTGSWHPSARSVLYGMGIALVIIGIIVVAATWGGQRIAAKPAWNVETSAVLIYSETCPHCHALINYLEGKNAFEKLNIVKTTDPSPYIPLLAKMGINFGGVPTFIVYLPEADLPATIKTAPFLIIVGFPSDYQNKDGYFMGREKELEYCQGTHGTPYYESNTYLFCVLPDGTILGNEHAVNWILQHI